MEKKCFIACPISQEGTDTRKRSDDLFNYIITPVCEKLGFKPIRIDKEYHNDKIDRKIIEYLNESELVIVDLTESNPNVFFELGYRMAIKKPLIQMMQEGGKIPFDVATYNTLFYRTDDLGSANRTSENLENTINKLIEEEKIIKEVTSEVKADEYNSKLSTEILNSLFKLQNSVDLIQKVVEKNNAETIKTIVDSAYNLPKATTADEEIKKELMKTLFNNPDNFKNLLEVADMMKEFENKNK